MCFVGLEKAFDCVPCGILWEVVQEYVVWGPLLRAAWSLIGAGAWSALLSDLFEVQAGLPIVISTFHYFYGQDFCHNGGLSPPG